MLDLRRRLVGPLHAGRLRPHLLLLLDQGITFFDNGDAYGNGRAEDAVRQVAEDAGIDREQGRDRRRSSATTFTPIPAKPAPTRERKQDFSPQFMRIALEQSLKRLGTDYIDLYMAHNIKLPQFRDDMFAELEKVKDEGKIKVWGVSLGPAIGWREEGFKAMMRPRRQGRADRLQPLRAAPRPGVLRDRPRDQGRRAGPRARQQLDPEGRRQDRHRRSARTTTASSATSPGRSTA